MFCSELRSTWCFVGYLGYMLDSNSAVIRPNRLNTWQYGLYFRVIDISSNEKITSILLTTQVSYAEEEHVEKIPPPPPRMVLNEPSLGNRADCLLIHHTNVTPHPSPPTNSRYCMFFSMAECVWFLFSYVPFGVRCGAAESTILGFSLLFWSLYTTLCAWVWCVHGCDVCMGVMCVYNILCVCAFSH